MNTLTWNTEQLIEQDIAHHLHPVTNLHRHKQGGPVVLVEGKGSKVRDTEGKWYIDGFAGLWNVNVGYGRTELAEVAREQMARLAFQPTFFGLATPPVIELATRMHQLLPHHSHFQFTSGGAESNETAIKIARYYWALSGKPEKTKIISRRMAYHGIAMGALAATGVPAYHADFGPLPPGFLYLSAPLAYRNNPGLSEAEFVGMLARELEDLITREGAETIAAFIGEPVQGAGGVVPPPEGYWQAIASILKKHDILLIADEVITGFGRTGAMFAQTTYGFQADITSFAKGITSGYIPLGGVGITPEIFERISAPDRMFMHGFTYSGHPVACAVALANIDIIERERLWQNAAERGEQLLRRLQELESHPHVGNVRGKGLMALVEVVEDKTSKKTFDASKGMGAKLMKVSREKGVIVRCNDTGFAIAPPLVITEAEVDQMVNALAETLDEVLDL
ncbi:aspartate aminotransferase family protein [Meiothermus hypogaeus]|uniref:Aspartate aminotransferase family protein n=2 Tax=Meiothermus hypogaeus TaxID=884155 RepID=A0A511R6J0_9DEIN|nr:aspartate aminotransferase family protein [Meiothermus hypogaeus]RIH75149.1 putative aminotransferase [Meiothermus hypogaeus]GEM85234.1 aspartate aminotransferase family protein [Meiothermus hypogaeus NBRC 106114]